MGNRETQTGSTVEVLKALILDQYEEDRKDGPPVTSYLTLKGICRDTGRPAARLLRASSVRT